MATWCLEFPVRFAFLVIFIFLCILTNVTYNNGDDDKFPDDFMFGISTAAYQIEGAWNESGKGENIWDRYTHQNPDKVIDKSNGDIACDSYHQYNTHVQMLKTLGVQFYRFSISWSRILPTGYVNHINEEGIAYYNHLIDELIANGIEPMVCLYHWDLPVTLQDIGGLANGFIVDYFEDYARIAFTAFGDRVKYWTTFNEPITICGFGYGGDVHPPAINQKGIGIYLCGHVIIKCHARVYHLYDDEFREEQKGKVGIGHHIMGHLSMSDSSQDRRRTRNALQMHIGWFLHPIWSKGGDYPPSMKKTIKAKSLEQGFFRSRLPEFTKEEIDYIKGSSDFLGVNHYTSFYVVPKKTKSENIPSFFDDLDAEILFDPTWKIAEGSWLRVYPEGLRMVLNYIKDEYDNPVVVITENGYTTTGGINDIDRVQYIRSYLHQILLAIKEDKCNVKAYAYWTLMDNFEWRDGYSQRFGLYEANCGNDNITITPRMSAFVYADIIKSRKITNGYLPLQKETGEKYIKYPVNSTLFQLFDII